MTQGNQIFRNIVRLIVVYVMHIQAWALLRFRGVAQLACAFISVPHELFEFFCKFVPILGHFRIRQAYAFGPTFAGAVLSLGSRKSIKSFPASLAGFGIALKRGIVTLTRAVLAIQRGTSVERLSTNWANAFFALALVALMFASVGAVVTAAVFDRVGAGHELFAANDTGSGNLVPLGLTIAFLATELALQNRLGWERLTAILASGVVLTTVQVAFPRAPLALVTGVGGKGLAAKSAGSFLVFLLANIGTVTGAILTIAVFYLRGNRCKGLITDGAVKRNCGTPGFTVDLGGAFARAVLSIGRGGLKGLLAVKAILYHGISFAETLCEIVGATGAKFPVLSARGSTAPSPLQAYCITFSGG